MVSRRRCLNLSPLPGKSYLSNWSASVFRILRVRFLNYLPVALPYNLSQRHRFTKSFALEDLRHTLAWRLRERTSLQPDDAPEDICRIIPPPATDSSGRPIAIVLASRFATLSFSEASKRTLLRTAETLRLHMLYANMISNLSIELMDDPVLQFTAIFDVSKTPMHSFVRNLFC